MPSNFSNEDVLFRDFSKDELDDDGSIDVNTLRLPDMSCNWKRFSKPEDIRFRQGGNPNNGCYAISVADVRFKKFANACHDPLCEQPPQNYSHVEIRQLNDGEGVDFEPPKNRKKSKSKKQKQIRSEWRTNLVNQLQILIDAE